MVASRARARNDRSPRRWQARWRRLTTRSSLQPFLSGFAFPVFMTHAGDGTNRLWVVEKSGLIKLVVNGEVRDTPFLDLVDEVVDAGEQGLLGLAFHPQYETNRRFFVWYTASRFSRPASETTPLPSTTVSVGNPEIADAAPVHTFLSIPDFAGNHNAGTIAFGQDGKLYLATGDGGASALTAQDPQSLFGKVLRIDVDAPQTPQTTPDPRAPTTPFRQTIRSSARQGFVRRSGRSGSATRTAGASTV